MQPEPQNPNDSAAQWIEKLGTHAIGDPEWTEAIEALSKLGFFVVPTLIDALDGGNMAVRTGILKALRRMGPKVLYDIVDALKHDSLTVRNEAANFLIGQASRPEMPITDIVSPLIAALNAPEMPDPTRIAQALAFLGDNARTAVSALIEALRGKDSFERMRVAIALGAIGPAAKAAVPALREALLDDDEFLREEARQALEWIQAEHKE